jgi:hypothetical protein
VVPEELLELELEELLELELEDVLTPAKARR